MIDAAICDGDWVVVRQQQTAENGDIVAAMLEDEATVKMFKQRDGNTWLLPRNSAFEPIPGEHAVILGKVSCCSQGRLERLANSAAKSSRTKALTLVPPSTYSTLWTFPAT